jgi:hypothetical protein
MRSASTDAEARRASPATLDAGSPHMWFEPLTASRLVGGRRFPPPVLVLLAGIGAVFLIVVATTSWSVGSDELAYWRGAERLLAGGPLYDPAAVANTPYAYWYPPPLAQVLAPLTPFISPDAFTVAWTVLLLACLWWLGGRDPLVALALIAFLPVAVELRTRNVHLILAVLIVLALRRSSFFWIPAAALKIAPVLGGVYLLAAGRVREALVVGVAGAAVLVGSFLLAPEAWREFIEVVGLRAGTDGGSLVAVPFALRFAVGALLAAVGGRVGGTRGEILLVVGVTVANPTLWATAFSILIAIVPLLRSPQPSRATAGGAVAPTPR